MWESQIQQLIWEPEPRPDSQLWKWTFLLELGTWLCFQQGPYFIAQFWESALSKPGSHQQVSVRSCLLLVLVLSSSRIFIVSCPGPPWPVSLSPVALIYTPGLKFITNLHRCSWWQLKCFLKLSGHQASLVCCCGVPSSLRFHPPVMG